MDSQQPTPMVAEKPRQNPFLNPQLQGGIFLNLLAIATPFIINDVSTGIRLAIISIIAPIIVLMIIMFPVKSHESVQGATSVRNISFAQYGKWLQYLSIVIFVIVLQS